MIITRSKSATDSPNAISFHYPEGNDAGLSLPVGSILVSFLVSPINPQDLLVIAGRYPVKPSYDHDDEAVLGYDGVARVEAVGGESTSSSERALSPGDLVIPRRHGLGTWRSRAFLNAADVIRLSPTSDLVGASLLRMAFLPAYLLVEDMRDLKPGDWIVQNAGSGTIARLVAQFARVRGCHTCSVVRDRDEDDLATLKVSLLGEGADAVITESQLVALGAKSHPALASASASGRVVLAIDAVFGEPGERLSSILSHGELRFRNFRLSEQLGKRTPAQQESLLLWFQDLLARGTLVTPKVQEVQVPESAGDRGAFEEQVKYAVASGGSEAAPRIGDAKRVLRFESV